jgi:hypothetical protein
VKFNVFIIALLTTACIVSAQRLSGHGSGQRAHDREKPCVLQREEMDFFVSYLSEGGVSPRVVMTTIVPPHADIDALNLQLAAQGRGIPPDVRADFKEKNKSSCVVKPFVDLPHLHFISESEHDLMFRTPSEGWSEFYKKYGKEAEMLFLSRVGFNRDKTLALFHVSSEIGPMAASGSLICVRKETVSGS